MMMMPPSLKSLVILMNLTRMMMLRLKRAPTKKVRMVMMKKNNHLTIKRKMKMLNLIQMTLQLKTQKTLKI
jgi:hypothetical protein